MNELEDFKMLCQVLANQRNSLMDQLAMLAVELHKAKSAIPPPPIAQENVNDNQRHD